MKYEIKMKNFFTRLSHLSQGILNCLDNKNLARCREISRSWRNYLDTQKCFPIRFITGTLEDFHEETNWRKFKMAQSTILAVSLGQSKHRNNNWTQCCCQSILLSMQRKHIEDGIKITNMVLRQQRQLLVTEVWLHFILLLPLGLCHFINISWK